MPPLTRARISYRCLNDVEFDFTSPDDGTPSPFMAFVGPNGAGKTTVLDAVALTVHRKFSNFTSVGKPEQLENRTTLPIHLEFAGGQHLGCNPKEGTTKGFNLDPTTARSVLYVRSGYVPDMVGQPLRQGPAQGLSPDLALLPQRLERNRIEPAHQRVDAVHQWWMHKHWEYPRTTTLDRLWSALKPFLGDRVYAGVNPETHLPQFDVGGTRIDFNDLSSGERRIIVLFMEIVMHCGEDGLVLFDEPEAHFHPEWQKILPAALAQLLPRGQVIVATHSPFLIHGLPSHQLYILGEQPWYDEP